jgi:hypothetical protein
VPRRNAALIFWGAFIGAGVAADVVLAHGPADGDTLSEQCRRIPRPIALGLWAGFSAWFATHLHNGYPKET